MVFEGRPGPTGPADPSLTPSRGFHALRNTKNRKTGTPPRPHADRTSPDGLWRLVPSEWLRPVENAGFFRGMATIRDNLGHCREREVLLYA